MSEQLKSFKELLGNRDILHFQPKLTNQEVIVEDLDRVAEAGDFSALADITPIIGEYPILVADHVLKTLTDDEHLPVLARNNLENGVSQNLWYEQILPRQSRFFTIVLAPTSSDYQKHFKEKIQGQPIQIGGNASICLLYTSPSPRDRTRSRMPSSA